MTCVGVTPRGRGRYALFVSLGPHVSEWRDLRDALLALVEDAGALDAWVLDAWDNLWCAAHLSVEPTTSELDALAKRALMGITPSLARGGKLDRVLPSVEGRHAHARSFANVYFVLVAYDAHARDVALAITRHLPTIERLTVALPPPDGTSGHAAARRLLRSE